MAPRLIVALAVILSLAAPAAADARRSLRAFSSCDQLLDFARDHGESMARTGWTPPIAGVVGAPLPATTQEDTGAAPQQQASAKAAPDFSDTNVQEEGVDEPDVIKTDGKLAYAVANGVLHVVDVRSDAPKLLGTLKLAEGSGHELLLRGDRLLVLQNASLPLEQPAPTPAPDQPTAQSSLSLAPFYGRPVARLTEVGVKDPAAPKILRTDRVDGSYVTARRTGDVARVVISSPARAFEVLPAAGTTASRGAAVGKAKLSAFRPRAYSRDRARGRKALYPIVPCREVRRPIATFAGLATVTVLTIDLEKGLPAIDADAIMADAETVYGSPGRLYVASRRWLPPQTTDDAKPPPITTQIHAFDVSSTQRTEYAGSGSVSGFLLNQFSLSEHEGRLRVASTDQPQWWGTQPQGQSQSFVTVLDAGSLTEVGKVGGLGAGEQIYAVRFIGDVGYVVTFRRIDPLYTIDLSTPAKPRVAGELKIAGYSAYLHPVDKDLLLGVGQDAGEDGRTRGTQLSLFDVSDPAKPTRLQAKALGDGSNSSVEFDHRAFLWWGPKDLAVVPVSAYGDGTGPPFLGAVGFGVTRAAIAERGRVQHPAGDYPPQVTRSLVVGDRLFTLSDAGLLASGLDTLQPGPWVPFPGGPGQR